MHDMQTKKTINIGLVGAGYMGKVHSIALHSVVPTFNTGLRPVPYMLCTSTEAGARAKAHEFGFLHATSQWQTMVSDPNVDAIIIASPPETHRDMALAALDNNKHVFCEKPLAATLEQSRELTDRAKASGLIHMVGFNYIHTPAVQAARRMIADNVLGQVHYLRAEHSEDFLANPEALANWRTRDEHSGAAQDIGPHLVNCALALMGDMSELIADIGTVYNKRPSDASGQTWEEVKSDDQGHILCRFYNGALGNLFFSRVATGQKMGYRFEVYGDKGALKYDQEDQNALWYFDMAKPKAVSGFTKILMSDAHPDFASLCSGTGHGTGYTEQIVIEMRNFIAAIDDGSHNWPTFEDGFKVDAIIEAALESNQQKCWVKVGLDG